jgi:predicted metal-binding membrane protein
MAMSAEMAMPLRQAWGSMDLLLAFVMWSVMMLAMMVPSASPMVLLFAKVNRTRREREAPFVATAFFLAGYLLVWVGFSALATASQWGLHSAALLSSMMVARSPVVGGLLLVGAGIFQWTSLKRACLVHCRSPLHFLMGEWRDGRIGALRMGLQHGMYCVGCCWVLMTLLFVAGVMNLLWVAAITLFVLVEKVVPGGPIVGRVVGIVLLLVGGGVIWRGF